MEFTLTSSESLPIRGDLDVPDRPRALVVIVHGFKGFKDWGFFPWVAQRLLSHRLAVCRFNMSRSGIGEEPETFDRLDLFEDDTYSTQLADLRTVVAYAQEQAPGLSTFLFGHSRGHLEQLNTRTKQMMRMSTRILDDYEANHERLDVMAAARALTVPLLVVHGGRDESVPVDEGRRLAAANDGASFLMIERASHTFNAIHPLVHVPFELVIAAESTAHFVYAHA